MWSYKPQNQAKINPIERYAPSLPSPGGLMQR